MLHSKLPSISSLKQQAFVASRLLWVKILGVGWLGGRPRLLWHAGPPGRGCGLLRGLHGVLASLPRSSLTGGWQEAPAPLWRLLEHLRASDPTGSREIVPHSLKGVPAHSPVPTGHTVQSRVMRETTARVVSPGVALGLSRRLPRAEGEHLGRFPLF